MLILTGNRRLTRDVELRATRSGKSVATVSVASDRLPRAGERRARRRGKRAPPVSVAGARRDRRGDPVYVDLILWEGQAETAAQHLVKGQAVAFTGRLEPRAYQTRTGEQRVAI